MTESRPRGWRDLGWTIAITSASGLLSALTVFLLQQHYFARNTLLQQRTALYRDVVQRQYRALDGMTLLVRLGLEPSGQTISAVYSYAAPRTRLPVAPPDTFRAYLPAVLADTALQRRWEATVREIRGLRDQTSPTLYSTFLEIVKLHEVHPWPNGLSHSALDSSGWGPRTLSAWTHLNHVLRDQVDAVVSLRP